MLRGVMYWNMHIFQLPQSAMPFSCCGGLRTVAMVAHMLRSIMPCSGNAAADKHMLLPPTGLSWFHCRWLRGVQTSLCTFGE